MISRRTLLRSAFAFSFALAVTPWARAENACSAAFHSKIFEGPRVIVISAPSGGGKTTLMKMLVNEHPDRFAFSVSTTTRAPRAGEVNGKDYEFIAVDEFK